MSKNAVNILMCHRSGKSRGGLSNATLIIIVSLLLTCCDLSIFMRFINVYAGAPGSGYDSAGWTLEFYFFSFHLASLVPLCCTRLAMLHSKNKILESISSVLWMNHKCHSHSTEMAGGVVTTYKRESPGH